ncbi:MAG: type II secretion system protein GspH [Betaproteobacteria bacterium]|nr:type II secretion system protein GspH [Betaproteobacteria bacterium]NBP11213.1 type II secretion system protein GspH [Betaproteobacteria bacterium]NDD95742.1 type II secretion system protein GspH [Betaproteobacteria bacterium]NDF19819.1 type II secretion system protein GspH [Betaproteobacteria bacterium]NDF92141.1 type II secretion system protein GspH [Betaproteobacteria bacterium]
MCSAGAPMASLVAMAWMQMWVTGRFRPPLSFASRPKRASWLCACRGFSLIEVLVVLVLLGIVMSFASLSLRGLQGRGLALEAERLGARIQVAQQEASLLAQPIRLELDDRGYRFYRNQLGRWLLIEGDDILKPRAWDALTDWRNNPALIAERSPNEAFVLAIGAEPIAAPFTIVLLRDKQAVILQSDGLGPIRHRSL